MTNITLPAEVAAKYELVGWTGGHHQHFGPRFGDVNLKTISLAQADALVAKGFKKLQPKAEKPFVATAAKEEKAGNK